MILETLGTVKVLSALKCGVTGLASSVPPLVNNSIAATQQMVSAATPVVTKAATTVGHETAHAVTVAKPVVIKGAKTAGHGAILIGGMTAKGLMAAKAGAAKLGAKLAGSTAAAIPAAKGTLGTSLTVPTSGQAIVDGVVKSVSFS